MGIALLNPSYAGSAICDDIGKNDISTSGRLASIIGARWASGRPNRFNRPV